MVVVVLVVSIIEMRVRGMIDDHHLVLVNHLVLVIHLEIEVMTEEIQEMVHRLNVGLLVESVDHMNPLLEVVRVNVVHMVHRQQVVDHLVVLAVVQLVRALVLEVLHLVVVVDHLVVVVVVDLVVDVVSHLSRATNNICLLLRTRVVNSSLHRMKSRVNSMILLLMNILSKTLIKKGTRNLLKSKIRLFRLSWMVRICSDWQILVLVRLQHFSYLFFIVCFQVYNRDC